MCEDFIIKNEIMNDGRAVHLYFNKMYGEYVAYGYSAFIVKETIPDIVTNHLEAYSSDFQMPMVRVNTYALDTLKKELIIKSYGPSYVQFHNLYVFNELKYDDWASFLRK